MKSGSEKSVPIAKITRPVVSDILRRERLFNLLDEGCKRPVIWISAPAGSGKTALIASYLESRKLPCLWYGLDEGDADPASFFYYVGLAAKKAVPGKKKPLPLLTPEYSLGIPTFTRRYFENLFSRLTRRGDRPVAPITIVFDNYQDVPSPLFHDMIVNGLDVIPDSANVIILSRHEPPPPFARLRAGNKVALLGWDEIRFTFEETKEIVRSGVKGIDDETLWLLHDKTSGWAAGLILLTEYLKTGKGGTRLAELIPEEIFDYFAGEVFARTEKDVQGFLLKTAFLPNMTGRTAERLTGVQDSGNILYRLSRNHFFTDGHQGIEAVYSYHPLFREFLLSEAKKTFPPMETASVRRNAAALLDEAGQIEDAAALYIDSSHWDGLAALILKHAQTMVSQGRNKTVGDWISSIPEAVRGGNPWLLFWLGLCRIPFNPAEGVASLEKAFNLFREHGDSAGMFLSWSWVVHSITHLTLDLKPLDKWIPVFEEIMDASGEIPSGEIGAGVAGSMFMALLFRQPNHPEIGLWAERASNLLKDCRDINIRVQTLINLAYYRTRRGDFEDAKVVIDELQRLSKSRDATPLVILLTRWMESVYFTFTSEHERCLDAVEDGLNLAEHTGIHILDFMLLGHGALSALNQGDIQTAGEFLKRMAPFLDRARPVDRSFYHQLMTHEALLDNNIRQALSHVDLIWEEGKDTGFPVIESIYHIEKAHVMHGLGENKKAWEHLEQFRKIGQMMACKPAEFMYLLAHAYFTFKEGDNESGLSFLHKAMAFGREHGYMNAYFGHPGMMAQLCCKALEAGIEVEYVREVIRRQNLNPPQSPFAKVGLKQIPPLEKWGEGGICLEAWPWPVKVYTLGRFELLIDDKPAAFSRKAPKKPLEMLKAIIASGGRASEEALSDALWPDAEGDAAHESFAVTLKRLRHLIGCSDAIEHLEGCVSLTPRYCWVDTFAFEGIMNGIERCREGEGTPSDESMRLAEKALDMYKGAFLPMDNEQHYILSFRERLRQKFLHVVETVGSCYEEKGEIKKAVRCYRKGHEVDDLAEVFYQRLMVCYEKMGSLAEAINVYKRCRNILSAKLGILPSRETERIYKAISGSPAFPSPSGTGLS